jgi:oligogalacturonide transporter
MNDGKVSTKNKLAFAAGDIFGGGTFNIINFLFVPFLTLMVGIPMLWASPLLLLTKVWDGIVDPFIGKITDGKSPNKYGKRRYFMLIASPMVLVGLILLFFPWNLVTSSLPLKLFLVTFVYILYATAQSFVLIPYYSLASEMTENFTERNRVNAVRLAFSIASSLVCVAVPGLIASPSGTALTQALNIDAAYGYIIMSAIFGLIFMCAILVTALFAREQVVTPAVQRKLTVKEFFKPLKLKTYRKYLGMQMATSMAMAVMSSFFFVFCDFVLRRDTYRLVMTEGIGRFPIGTVAAAAMFVAQIFALPFYLNVIKRHGKRFAYILSAVIWMALCVAIVLMPAEKATLIDGVVVRSAGVADWVIILMGLSVGFGIGGCVFIPHSSFGDVCDVGQLYFGERTEGAFSGLTNFLNTTAQAIGLSLPALVMGISAFGGYKETQYLRVGDYAEFVSEFGGMDAVTAAYKVTQQADMVQLSPIMQTDKAQVALRIVFAVLPILVMVVGVLIAHGYKLTKEKQERIVEIIGLDKDSEEYIEARKEILEGL